MNRKEVRKKIKLAKLELTKVEQDIRVAKLDKKKYKLREKHGR